ncbi:TetR family transcriptional regulator [Kibdelosporangium phytohabitans]|uniref:TetR family transcriptional regulator n=2 Tax=Kibdelosporangium phytohabitans TaxID=860235 RepID=A0A0N9I0R8_9PSEU|nr:TetR/AcrR family transcriptional regulator [Kibdelosporangium phytohabitans]ALG08259.1 TetR family transcriptional regulator [Kibdelosporangium phytohabitans]
MPRAGLSTRAVVRTALELIDEGGVEGLTLAAVAQRTGVATPSLYKHVTGLAELRTLLGIQVLEEMTERFTAAVLGRSGDEAVTALMHAYRGYVLDHPHRYTLMPLDPLHDPALADAGGRLIGVVFAALRDYGLTESQTVQATRRLRVVAHGFASLEANGGFGLPEDLDETYAQLIAVVLPKKARV